MQMKLKKNRPYRILVLLAWILGILVPFYSVSGVYAPFRAAVDRVFQTQTSHVIMHMFLYAVLTALIMSLLFSERLSTFQILLFALAGTALIAIFQEAFQMLSEGVALGADEFFDFFVDLSGGALGAMLYLLVSRQKRYQAAQSDLLD